MSTGLFGWVSPRKRSRAIRRPDRLSDAVTVCIEGLESRLLLSAVPHRAAGAQAPKQHAASHTPLHPQAKKPHDGGGDQGSGTGDENGDGHTHGHAHGNQGKPAQGGQSDQGGGNSHGQPSSGGSSSSGGGASSGTSHGGSSGSSGGHSSGSGSASSSASHGSSGGGSNNSSSSSSGSSGSSSQGSGSTLLHLGPVASISAADITTEGGATETITVTYTDLFGVSAASIKPGNISVTGPGGALTVTAAQADGPDGSPLVATYTVAAHGGAWSNADNGSYTISLNANQVSDILGLSAGGASGTFNVNIAAPVLTGSADPSFANGQTVSAGFVVEALLTQSDGKILAIGHEGDASTGQSVGVIERLNPDGSVDSSFGAKGQILTAVGANAAYYAAVEQDSSHFVVGGTSGGDFVLRRFNLNGKIDSTFGANGTVVTDFGTSADAARALAIAPGGLIVAAGDSGGNFAFARYLANGQLDTNFAQAGRQLFGLGTGSNGLGDVAVESDGRIVAGGAEGGSVVLVGLTSAGEADGTFGKGGLVTVSGIVARQDTGQADRTEGLALQGANILVANRTADGHFGLVRLTAAGTVDKSFGTNGLATANFGGDDDADSIVVQSTGDLLVIGTSLQAGTADTAVAAFDANGKPLTTFGTNGKLLQPAGLTLTTHQLHVGDIVLRAFGTRTPDGRVVIGTSDQAVATTTSSTLRRLIVPGAQFANGSVPGTPLGQFGMVNGKRTNLIVPESDGSRITLSLAGGTGTAYQVGNRIALVINDLGRGVALSVSGRGGSGHVSLGDVTVSGTLKSMFARNGNLQGTLHVTGAIGQMALGDISGTIFSGAAIAAVSGGDLTGNLFATGALGRARLGEIKGTIASGSGVIGTITASALNNARILSGANLGADGAVGGAGLNADKYGAGAIGSIRVAGAITSSFIGAGVDPVNQTFGDTDDKVIGGAASDIRSLAAGSADNASRFEAGAFRHVRVGSTTAIQSDPRFRVL